MNKSVSHRSVELNISGDKQSLTFTLLNVTVFGNVVVSWRESSCWLSLLKLILHAWWLAPKQALHTIHSGHISRKDLRECGTKDQHLPSSGSCFSKEILSSLGRSSNVSRHTTGWYLGILPRRRLVRSHYSAMYIWTLQWSGKEDFSEGFDVVLSVNLVRKQDFINITKLVCSTR